MSEPSPNQSSALTAEVITEALQALSDELGKRSLTGEVCLFGGTVMVLAFNARLSTKDVDAIFQPTQVIREIAEKIGEGKKLVKGWLNDGVKGFVVTEPSLTSAGLPQFANLRVTMPVAEYLLAMKCMAGRTGIEGGNDIPDVIFLARKLGLKSATEVLDIVARYYGKSGVPVKTQYLVEGLFEEGSI